MFNVGINPYLYFSSKYLWIRWMLLVHSLIIWRESASRNRLSSYWCVESASVHADDSIRRRLPWAPRVCVCDAWRYRARFRPQTVCSVCSGSVRMTHPCITARSPCHWNVKATDRQRVHGTADESSYAETNTVRGDGCFSARHIQSIH